MKAENYIMGSWVFILTQTLFNQSTTVSDRVALCLSPEPFKIENNPNTFFVFLAIRGSSIFIKSPIVRLEKIDVPMTLTIAELHQIDDKWLEFSKGLVFEQKTNHFRQRTQKENYPLLIQNVKTKKIVLQ